jgi:[ribosomal protein S5]-alanine N-acetyltransferase
MLEGHSVVLAPLGVDDVTDEYANWFNDLETSLYLGSKFGQTRATVRQYVEGIKPPNLLCKILAKENARHIGNIALQEFNPVHRRMELGIVIGVSEARGRGIGREACSLLIDYAFNHLNLHKITAGTVDDNVAMKKVFLDLGFTIEGTLIEHWFVNGRYHDMYRFGLLKPNFTPGSRSGATVVDDLR